MDSACSEVVDGSRVPCIGRPRTFTPRDQRRLEDTVKNTLSGRTKRSRVYTAFHEVS
jgi:hypothetical protein